MSVTYDAAWHAERHWMQEWSTRALLAAFALFGVPTSLLDVGCGEGHLVKVARALGLDAVGVDLAVPIDQAIDGLLPWDLRLPLNYGRTFDLVLCWEVAEHLPVEVADTLVASVARHVGTRLIWTAAVPGQGGLGHVNEQPARYWEERLEAQGLCYSQVETARLRPVWKWACGPCHWYPKNLQMFTREAAA